ncbi:MAG: hypothetical protein ACFFER_08610 [Candidatus Thorarchaeota archaeon]
MVINIGTSRTESSFFRFEEPRCDGERPAELMIDHELGVEVVEQFTINEVGDAFFEQIDTEH